jgi:hypothetical protein
MSELERALVAVGRELDVPEAPDVVQGVLARIGPRPRLAGLGGRRRIALAVALAALAVLAATLAVPPARSALLRILHLGGERIVRVEELPEVPLQHDLEFVLGERVSLERARALSGLELRRLEEPPDRVYLGDRGTVWLLYGTPQQPRLLVAQTPGLALGDEILLKKLAGAGTRLENVTVDGSPGLFLSGEPHLVFLVDDQGRIVEETARLARDVLVWEEDGVAYRLEGELTKEDAIRLAESLG